MRERPALFLGLLADQPELIAEVGALRWHASGCVGTPGPWIESTASSAGRDVPFTLVAMDLEGQAVGAVTLGVCDEDLPDAERGGRTPWLVHLVVRRDQRRCGVGRLLTAALEDLAREAGFARVWVAAPDDDLAFYRHCGWHGEERLGEGTAGRRPVTVLGKPLSATLSAPF